MDTATRYAQTCNVRAARVTDIEAMLSLLQALFSIEADFTFNSLKARAALTRLLQRGDRARVFVAEAAGKVVGMCSVQIMISTAEGGEVGMVEDVVVTPDLRGQGVGRRMLGYLEQWSRQRGLTRLQLLIDIDNSPAHGFYRRVGWAPTRLAALRRML
jgi:GNAT superfamily N-acetyltransferase